MALLQAPWPTDKRSAHDRGWREENPLLANAGAYDDLIDHERRRGRNWRWASFLLLLGYAPMAASLAWSAAQSRVEPVIVMLDEDAREEPIIKTVEHFADRDVPPGVVGYFVAGWIENVRARPSDLIVAMDNLRAAYAYVAGDAANKLDEWMKAHDPRDLGKGEVVQVEIISIVQETEATWDVRWQETAYKNGYERQSDTYHGLVTLAFGRPRQGDDLSANPLGLDVVDFGWAVETAPVALTDEDDGP